MATQAEIDAAKALLQEDEVSKSVKVTFTPEQQAKIDLVIKDAQSRASKDLRAELDALKTAQSAAQTELAAAKEALAKAKTPAQRESAASELEAAQAEVKEMKAAAASAKAEREELRKLAETRAREAADARSEAMNDRKRAAISSVASELGFFEPADVVALTADRVKWNDELKRYTVVNEAGAERQNNALEPMTLQEYYTELGTQKKWMVRGDVRPGAGSTTGGGVRSGVAEVDQFFGPNADPKAKHQLANKDPERYRRLRDQAVTKGYKF